MILTEISMPGWRVSEDAWQTSRAKGAASGRQEQACASSKISVTTTVKLGSGKQQIRKGGKRLLRARQEA